MLHHDPDNQFDDDLADLLDCFDDSDNNPPSFIETNIEMEGLESFFHESFSEHLENSQINLSSLPSEQEIQAIFSEDIFGEENNNTPVVLNTNESIDVRDKATDAYNLSNFNGSKFEPELFNLFNENYQSEEISYPEILREKQEKFFFEEESENPWNELEELLADDLVSAEKNKSEKSSILEKTLANKIDNNFPNFYETFEELESLLETSATLLEKELNGTINIDDLEAFIKTPCTIDSPESPQKTSAPIEETKLSSANNNELIDDLDQEFI